MSLIKYWQNKRAMRQAEVDALLDSTEFYERFTV